MSKITVVSSCSAEGWVKYGRRFVETFLQFWPAEIELHLVSEDVIDVTGFPPRLHFHSLQASAQAVAFLARHEVNARAHGNHIGKEAVPHKQKIKSGYDFRCDAYRFSKKVFAIEMIANLVGEGRLFWVDADVETFAPMPVELLDRLLPEARALCCLDRGHYHSECGFVGYNLDLLECREFVTDFARLYSSDDVFRLPEWHDSWVFDWLRKKLHVSTFQIQHNSRSHPFVNSELGMYCDHKKGRRKDLGKTPVTEVLSSKKRALPYYSGARE